jgi:hypothetical protein
VATILSIFSGNKDGNVLFQALVKNNWSTYWKLASLDLKVY